MTVLRTVAAVLGALVVIATVLSVARTLVVPRGHMGWLERTVDRLIATLYSALVRPLPTYEARDRVLAGQAITGIATLLGTWLCAYLIGFGLLLWPFTHNLGAALRESGSAMFTLGFASTPDAGPTAVDLLAAAAGVATVALQVAYLPTIYSAFNRRETEITLLSARAGVPPWGPELLARTRVGLQAEDAIAGLYVDWERWAADIAESHSNYIPLVRLRSPQPYGNWLVALIAVLDSAALFHALAPTRAPTSGRLLLRMGFTCLRQIADTVGLPYDPDPRPDTPIQLTYDEFEAGVRHITAAGFPIETSPQQAWPQFRGWRVNYESIAYNLCHTIHAVPALWTGPRRYGEVAVRPARPTVRTPDKPDGLPAR